MAFVVYKVEEGALLVEEVYPTQTQANTAARRLATLHAYPGNVNEDVNPGDFITGAGALLSAPPAAVRDKREGVEYKSQIQAAFNGWVTRRPAWLADLGSTTEQDAAKGSLKMIFMMAALGDQIIEGNYLASISRTNRNSFLEHIVKTIQDDYRLLYDNLVVTGSTIRNNWRDANTADKATIYSNIVTTVLGTPKDPDNAYTAVTGVTIPDNFDPSQDNLRRS